jgi:hypothetical protein
MRRNPRTPKTRAELLAKMPRGLRPMLERDPIRNLALIHVQIVDDIAAGRGTEQTLCDYTEALLTWSRAAQLTGDGVPEMDRLLALGARLVERFKGTGRVEFIGDELAVAQHGSAVMDAISQRVGRETSQMAAMWSAAKLAALAAGARS